MKILCVEDGSVDVDAIERGDLKDGKVLMYRQGATPPFVLDIPEGESVWKGVEEFCKRASDMATEPYKQKIAVLEQELNDWRDGTIIVKWGEAEEKCEVLEKALEMACEHGINDTELFDLVNDFNIENKRHDEHYGIDTYDVKDYFINKAKEELGSGTNQPIEN